MIGKLQGIVDYIGDDFIILMAGPVGYKVFTTEYFTLKSTISLWIETIVREDSIRLFGFSTLSMQNLFNQLTTVSGVGPKVAMAIMSTIKTDSLITAIATGDAKTISSAPGVGKKMAEKIIV
ncbi:MAG: Holliday junction branch migration protein RuvA, partial [Alphaproteobacteria bacterium]